MLISFTELLERSNLRHKMHFNRSISIQVYAKSVAANILMDEDHARISLTL